MYIQWNHSNVETQLVVLVYMPSFQRKIPIQSMFGTQQSVHISGVSFKRGYMYATELEGFQLMRSLREMLD